MLSHPLTVIALVSHYLTNKLIVREPLPKRPYGLSAFAHRQRITCGIITGFPELYHTLG